MYGGLTRIAVIMIWFYFLMVCLMVCAEINYVYHDRIKAFTVAKFKRKVKTKGSELNQIRKERKNASPTNSEIMTAHNNAIKKLPIKKRGIVFCNALFIFIFPFK